MLLYDLISMPYKEFVPIAWQKYNESEYKGATYVGNHLFDIPYDIEYKMQYPHLYYHNGQNEDTGIKGAEKSGFQQHRFSQDSDFVQEVKEYFKIDYIYCAINNLQHRMMTAMHFDLNRSALIKYTPLEKQKKILAEDKHRYIVFLQDQEMGQIFQVGEQYLSWKAGDIYSFPWYMPHCTANCTAEDRFLLSVAGFVDPDTL